MKFFEYIKNINRDTVLQGRSYPPYLLEYNDYIE